MRAELGNYCRTTTVKRSVKLQVNGEALDFSPAPAVLSGSIGDIWIYLFAPSLGAALGVLGHKAIA